MTQAGPGRDYQRLFRAMNEALAAFTRGGDEGAALRASFDHAAAGFGAEKALLLLVEEREPLRIRSLEARGALSAAQVAACERGESVKGVSPSVIRAVVAGARAELIRDPRLETTARTASLAGGNFSVLCAPVVGPSQRVRAVLYFQNNGLADAFGPADLLWLEGYAEALSQAFGLFLERERREQELRGLLQGAEPPDDAPELVGESSALRALRRLLHETYLPALDAPQPDPILLLGERGTGKDLVARYLHAWSGRRARPFVAVSCGEISEELAPSRFFGHRKGAFTGAISDEPGLFRSAQGGVLFLDEIDDLPPRAQVSLLRVLENHAVTPVGDPREVRLDVAVVLATNRDLDEAVSAGRLRADFHDRFRVQAIRVPPLRERPYDVLPLLEHFRRHHERRSRKRTLGFTDEALAKLLAYEWPGNVRELARVCSLLVTYAAAGGRLDRSLLERCSPDLVRATPNPRAGAVLWDGATYEEALTSFKRELIIARLERHGGSKAARESLGLTKPTFHRYLRALGLRGRGATEDEQD